MLPKFGNIDFSLISISTFVGFIASVITIAPLFISLIKLNGGGGVSIVKKLQRNRPGRFFLYLFLNIPIAFVLFIIVVTILNYLIKNELVVVIDIMIFVFLAFYMVNILTIEMISLKRIFQNRYLRLFRIKIIKLWLYRGKVRFVLVQILLINFIFIIMFLRFIMELSEAFSEDSIWIFGVFWFVMYIIYLVMNFRTMNDHWSSKTHIRVNYKDGTIVNGTDIFDEGDSYTLVDYFVQNTDKRMYALRINKNDVRDIQFVFCEEASVNHIG